MKQSLIPINIHPLFWLFAALIGWLNYAWVGAGMLVGILVWVVIIFVSVLVHELGHALTAIAFGQRPRIDFIALGGLTSYQGNKLKLWQQFIVVLDGPLFGIFLFAFSTVILNLKFFEHPILINSFKILQFVNLFWSIVNLLPVLPLDGGQLLRIIFEGIWGVKGIRYSLFVGMLLAAALSFYFFLIQLFLIGALFFLFAFQAFDTWRKAKYLSSPDQDDAMKELLIKGEDALKNHQKQEAQRIFEDIFRKAKEGILFMTACQYLAFLYYEEGKVKEAYELLLPLKDKLTDKSICLLHRLAFLEKNYSLVTELSSDCYQVNPVQEVALKNAKAFAFLKRGKPAGGWLQTAFQFGNLDLEKVLSEEAFQPVLDDPNFKSFIAKIK